MKHVISLVIIHLLILLHGNRGDMVALLDELDKQLDGNVYLPDTSPYEQGSRMKNSRYSDEDLMAVVMVNNTVDVSKTLVFCRNNGIRPTVKSGGHDYIGRSTGYNSLNINLERLRDISVDRNDVDVNTGISAFIGAGNTMSDIYKKMDKENLLFVGASGDSVSVSGYTLGGGISVLSRQHGLAADNTVAFTMVTATGSIIYVTEDDGTIIRPGREEKEYFNDYQLYWALKGGGGGTFGIVTSFKVQLHPKPTGGFALLKLTFPISDATEPNAGQKILEYWSHHMLNDLTDSWGGYITISSPTNGKANGNISFNLLHVGGWAPALPTMRNLWQMYPTWTLTRDAMNYTSFLEYQNGQPSESRMRRYVINRLIQPADLISKRLAQILTEIKTFTDDSVKCTWTLLGGAIGKQSSEGSCINPNFRTAVGSLTCTIEWENPCDDKNKIIRLRGYGYHLYGIGNGAYINEPDYHLDNWRGEYWGTRGRYDMLLDVKERYDPEFMFWCHSCVGSEQSRRPPSKEEPDIDCVSDPPTTPSSIISSPSVESPAGNSSASMLPAPNASLGSSPDSSPTSKTLLLFTSPPSSTNGANIITLAMTRLIHVAGFVIFVTCTHLF